ncbi:EF-P 5-aminopentanol modification-associated protein YfmF [Peribacillus glennii]|uniref:Insulinase family protein n=1 Tax=Peribacillus glennii TaxID=2303991 RepID=A0A372L8B1_9BACI|nr:pitrilysin family protein [Peribacillus glennii]RFU61593.1 insulinase family protein [Peribacillus glennii]
MAIASEILKARPGYKLHIVKTEKYKTNTLVFKMKAPLCADTVTLRSLLPYVLQSTTERHPTSTELRSYLDELYGASLYVDVSKKGEYHIISFTMEIANEKFLSDPTPLLAKGFELLTDVIFHPKTEGDAFDSNTVQKEKRSLKQRIQSIYDDKMRYSAKRLVEEMCKDEPYALEQTGNQEDLEKITPGSLYEYYIKALAEDEIDLYIIGDVDEAEAESLADKYISLHERQPEKIKPVQKKVENENEVIEKQDVKQGKLNIGYRTNVVYGEEDYYALQLFNGIFGGFSHSKLFINVREKASLAYYAASRIESHKGLLMVMSGIENKNYGQAIDIIREQMEEMKKGKFTEEELSQTKAVVKNQILETVDVARGLVEVLYHNVVSGTSIPLDEWLERTEKTTKEQVVNVAQKIECDTIYFLTGTEVQE